MFKRILFILLSVVCQQLYAQINNDHVMLDAGALYERGFDATVSYEHSGKYHNAWEFFGTYYINYGDDPEAGHVTKDSFWNNYRSWHLGICYKPCVIRCRNSHGNLRIGVSGGSDTKDFLGGIHVGYEHSYVLYCNWEIFFQVKTDAVIEGEDLFRSGVAIGFKIPLTNN